MINRTYTFVSLHCCVNLAYAVIRENHATCLVLLKKWTLPCEFCEFAAGNEGKENLPPSGCCPSTFGMKPTLPWSITRPAGEFCRVLTFIWEILCLIAQDVQTIWWLCLNKTFLGRPCAERRPGRWNCSVSSPPCTGRRGSSPHLKIVGKMEKIHTRNNFVMRSPKMIHEIYADCVNLA